MAWQSRIIWGREHLLIYSCPAQFEFLLKSIFFEDCELEYNINKCPPPASYRVFCATGYHKTHKIYQNYVSWTNYYSQVNKKVNDKQNPIANVLRVSAIVYIQYQYSGNILNGSSYIAHFMSFAAIIAAKTAKQNCGQKCNS